MLSKNVCKLLRTVSFTLLPFLSKILEKVVFKQVSDFLSNNLPDAKKPNVNSGHSTESAL